ncbi:MAG: ribosome maturation factor RimP, partial [Actinomycetes bacterium]
MGKGDRLDDLRARLEAPLADLGLDLFDVVRTGKGRGTVVQVMVDRPGGVDLETVTEATRVISPLLDEWPGIDSAYTLEVSSPGLERPLRRPAHFAGARGMSVTVRCRDEAGVARRVRGVLVASDEEGCTVEVDGAPQR